MEFPDKFETELGERGVNLSGGQKQRISIARAIALDPSILLLDDCLSAVDTGTEELILKELKRAVRDRTCIMIAHRISTIKDADEIFVLDNGHIAESGTHEQLLQENGFYRRMYDMQLLEETIAQKEDE
jgi:ATP-binding cassette subfamily B protein